MEKKQQQVAMKVKRLSFKKRRACLKKKAMELSVLCDVEACVIVVDGNGEVETWPEDHSQVLKLIDRYRDCLRAADDQNEVLNDHQLDDCLLDGFSTESIDDFLKHVSGSDQNQNLVLDLHSWDDGLFDGLPTELLQQVLRELESKLEAVEKRIEVLRMVDDLMNNNIGKEIVIFDEAKLQGIQAPTTFPDTMCLFQGVSNQQIIQDSNFGWFGNGASFSSRLDLTENNDQGLGGAPEQGFLNLLYGQQTVQTPWFHGEEAGQRPLYPGSLFTTAPPEPQGVLFNMVPGMYPPYQFSPSRLSYFQESEFPEQSTLGFWRNWTE